MKQNHQLLKVSKSEKGQLSIFLSFCLVLIITLLAFIINVGLFVKAKINLQNAVDSAAYAGAATQARQLTNMAYLNWEMRNTYKEWMFKYYVLGQLGLNQTSIATLQNTSSNAVNFRTQPFYNSGESKFDSSVVDHFNVPSICIHFGTEHDICQIFDIPGVPRFETVGLPGISEQHEAFLNSIVETKSKDCSQRSDLNFATAMVWAYGTKTVLFKNAPKIAAHRPGAFTQAIELAMRMRTLEMVANRPPIVDGICLDPSRGENCSTSARELDSESNTLPFNERPSKAFWSAYRNLSGGDLKEQGSGRGSDLASTFTLREIAPNPLQTSPNTVSGFLIPSDANIAQSGVKASTKHYVDLQLYPINLVTFFTTFVSNTGEFEVGTSSEGRCGATKTALPVPSYPLGFIKNPGLITYYSVKGEARFIGLFYPFKDQKGIKMQAYASAKPFGGKIGPRLFSFGVSSQTVVARSDSSQYRSAPYISAFDTTGLDGQFKPGYPIPTKRDFWAFNTNAALGGVPGTGNSVKFGVPNLLYDFNDFSDIQGQANSAQKILILTPALNYNQGYVLKPTPNQIKGLYDRRQLLLFSQNLETIDGAILSAQGIDHSLARVRGPTRYEALNYLIPTFDDPNSGEQGTLMDSPFYIPDDPTDIENGQLINYSLYAPLIVEADGLYKNTAQVSEIMNRYLNASESAIDQFLEALKSVADSMRNDSSSNTQDAQAYINAANSIYPSDGSFNIEGKCDKISMASKFHQFFKGTASVCDIIPLKESLATYMQGQTANRDGNPRKPYQFFYQSTYFLKNGLRNSMLHSAYSPGERRGATADGAMPHPFNSGAGGSILGKRNYYSTKFFMTDMVQNNSAGNSFLEPTSSYQEKPNTSPNDLGPTSFLNPIDSTPLDIFGAQSH